MATVDRPRRSQVSEGSYFDEEGFPWLENGEAMDQETFHERYEKTPPEFKAELIGGIVYVASPVRRSHGRDDAMLVGWLFCYSASTPGTEVQNNATAILGDESEPRPDSALLVLEEYGGQTRDGEGEGDEYTYGAPELVVEVAASSLAIDLGPKFEDYQRAGVREYIVLDLKGKKVHWFHNDGRTFAAIPPVDDGTLGSRTFPGLWLDPVALFADDKPGLIAALNRGLASPEHAAFVAELQLRRDERADRPAG